MINKFASLMIIFLISACGGGGSNNAAQKTSTKAVCAQSTTLGQATFGSGCFN
jgi:hypothetical protein